MRLYTCGAVNPRDRPAANDRLDRRGRRLHVHRYNLRICAKPALLLRFWQIKLAAPCKWASFGANDFFEATYSIRAEPPQCGSYITDNADWAFRPAHAMAKICLWASSNNTGSLSAHFWIQKLLRPLN